MKDYDVKFLNKDGSFNKNCLEELSWQLKENYEDRRKLLKINNNKVANSKLPITSSEIINNFLKSVPSKDSFENPDDFHCIVTEIYEYLKNNNLLWRG